VRASLPRVSAFVMSIKSHGLYSVDGVFEPPSRPPSPGARRLGSPRNLSPRTATGCSATVPASPTPTLPHGVHGGGEVTSRKTETSLQNELIIPTPTLHLGCAGAVGTQSARNAAPSRGRGRLRAGTPDLWAKPRCVPRAQERGTQRELLLDDLDTSARALRAVKLKCVSERACVPVCAFCVCNYMMAMRPPHENAFPRATTSRRPARSFLATASNGGDERRMSNEKPAPKVATGLISRYSRSCRHDRLPVFHLLDATAPFPSLTRLK
jgi:hypothetical protein